MKKFLAISLIGLFWIPGMLHAQLDTFDLSTYKLPVIQRKMLNVDFNLNESVDFMKSKNEAWSTKSKDSYFNFANHTGVAYYSYKNTPRIQSIQNYAVSLVPEIKKLVSDDSITTRESNIQSGFSVSSNNRIYYQNQFFFEPDFLVSGTAYNKRYKNEQDDRVENDDLYTLYVKIPLLVGKGRIEQVQDARLAVYILDELQKSGRLARVPDNKEILELAALVSQVRNERYFDYRLHKIYEIEKVDSFLQARAIVTQPDARYFTVVNDNWDYAAGPVRESGRRISAGIVPDFMFTYRKEHYIHDFHSDYKTDNIDLSLIAQVNYIDAKPLNLKWQRDWSAEVSFGYGKLFYYDLLHDTDDNTGSMLLNGQIDYKLGFYPNSRTSISGLMSLSFDQINSKEEPDDSPETLTTKSHQTDIAPSFSLLIDYYISPQLRFSADFDLSYNYTNNNEKYVHITDYSYDKENRITQSLSAKLTYSFF